jgi:hypothetical protein
MRFLVGTQFVNRFVNGSAPVNFRKKARRLNPQHPSQVKQLGKINPQRAVLDFGNGAASSILPARKLQLVGKRVLRPAMLVTQSGDLPSDEISFYHGTTP